MEKDDAYNSYGDAERKVEIKALGGRNTFIRVMRCGVSKGEVCINGRFGYTAKNNPMKAGRAKAEDYR